MSHPTPRCPVCGSPAEVDEDGQLVCLGEHARPPCGIDPEIWALALRLTARLRAGERLADDLDAAVGQYETAVPRAHVALVLQRYRERLPEPRTVAPYRDGGEPS
jgi:hypothetical protein